jgi:predicted SnoaL-like aldol condensation-catalyzing enzyme
MPCTAAANRALVEEYVTTALVEGRWEDVDRFFDEGRYVLHGPLFADGLESVRSFFVGLRDAGVPFLITGTSVWLSAGDFVLAINRHDADGVSTAYWDLWRVDDGAIAEHWDVIAQIPAESADAWFAGESPSMPGA